MKRFLEELAVAALAWIPTTAGMGARLLLWRPLFKKCGKVRFGTGLAMQGCNNMSLADGVRVGRGCQLYAEGGTLEMGEDAALSPGVTADASGGLLLPGVSAARIVVSALHEQTGQPVPGCTLSLAPAGESSGAAEHGGTARTL